VVRDFCYIHAVKLLDPKLDIVFKLLLQREQVLLRSMIETVVTLPAAIEELEILNPEIPRELVADKGVFLDVRVSLANHAKVDIEMQSELPTGIRSRFLYYWAKEYSGELQRGDVYPQLIPVISIIWLGKNLLNGEKFHSVFHIAEDTTHELFCKDLEFHTLELRKLRYLSEVNQPQLYRWSRFLLADSDEELDKLAQEDPIMQTAKTTLEAISADPGAQSLAREREMARRAHEHLLYCARVEAKAEGRAEGEARTILAFLEARDIVVTEAQRERILQCTDFERLSTWVRKAVTLSDVNELFAE
jgi:predicted transposase/invertase (TIGR01784 family)